MDQIAAMEETVELARVMLLHDAREKSAATLDHLESMLTRAKAGNEDGTPFSPSRLGRWLGWMQCAVYMRTHHTLDTFKEINRRHLSTKDTLDLVFRGELPNAVFVEAEIDGRSAKVGEWTDPDPLGFHRLRIKL